MLSNFPDTVSLDSFSNHKKYSIKISQTCWEQKYFTIFIQKYPLRGIFYILSIRSMILDV